MTTLTGLVLVAYTFKFAKFAEINQGCMASLFSVTSIYVGVVFYFKFNEVISGAKMVGMLLMLPCAILLSLDKKEAEDSDYNLTVRQMRLYGLVAVIFALLGPICWTLKGFYIRKAKEIKNFPIYDLAIDAQGWQYLVSACIYLAYLVKHPFVLSEAIEGAITGFCFTIASILFMNAYETGPGGPINALISTQLIYQTSVNAIFFD